jgi:hypothetical protein
MHNLSADYIQNIRLKSLKLTLGLYESIISITVSTYIRAIID